MFPYRFFSSRYAIQFWCWFSSRCHHFRSLSLKSIFLIDITIFKHYKFIRRDLSFFKRIIGTFWNFNANFGNVITVEVFEPIFIGNHIFMRMTQGRVYLLTYQKDKAFSHVRNTKSSAVLCGVVMSGYRFSATRSTKPHLFYFIPWGTYLPYVQASELSPCIESMRRCRHSSHLLYRRNVNII